MNYILRSYLINVINLKKSRFTSLFIIYVILNESKLESRRKRRKNTRVTSVQIACSIFIIIRLFFLSVQYEK